MERSKKKCVHCRRLEPHKRKDSVGICSLYNVAGAGHTLRLCTTGRWNGQIAELQIEQR